jgi:hypothetical protein
MNFKTATKEERREYLRAWRAAKAGEPQVCECSNAATVERSDGWICQRCADLEDRRTKAENRRKIFQNRYGYKIGGPATHSLRLGKLVN